MSGNPNVHCMYTLHVYEHEADLIVQNMDLHF